MVIIKNDYSGGKSVYPEYVWLKKVVKQKVPVISVEAVFDDPYLSVWLLANDKTKAKSHRCIHLVQMTKQEARKEASSEIKRVIYF